MATTKDYVPSHEHKEYITRKDCEIFMKVEDCKDIMGKTERALFGEDGLGGMAHTLTEIKTTVDSLYKERNEEKKKGRDWRLLAFAIVGSTVTGVIVAVVTFALTHLH